MVEEKRGNARSTSDASMTNMSLDSFAEVLAAKESVPGGGGAAAYVGALGVALGSMVANFTVGKKRYAAYEQDILRLIDEAKELRIRLVELIDGDAEAFQGVGQAYALKRDDPQRESAISNACLEAAQVPLLIMQACAESIELLEEIYEKGSRMLLSDVGCGALLCGAALRSAALNVFVNTASAASSKRAEELEQSCDELLSVWVARADDLACRVSSDIRNKE